MPCQQRGEAAEVSCLWDTWPMGTRPVGHTACGTGRRAPEGEKGKMAWCPEIPPGPLGCHSDPLPASQDEGLPLHYPLQCFLEGKEGPEGSLEASSISFLERDLWIGEGYCWVCG